ncbi:hypothetical protein B0H11DRAFT_2371811 [Mycena galericulata]|nr:hypothetical protein B0H11DRAFT_2371811 [Mycena galericulata]
MERRNEFSSGIEDIRIQTCNERNGTEMLGHDVEGMEARAARISQQFVRASDTRHHATGAQESALRAGRRGAQAMKAGNGVRTKLAAEEGRCGHVGVRRMRRRKDKDDALQRDCMGDFDRVLIPCQQQQPAYDVHDVQREEAVQPERWAAARAAVWSHVVLRRSGTSATRATRLGLARSEEFERSLGCAQERRVELYGAEGEDEDGGDKRGPGASTFAHRGSGGPGLGSEQ